MSTEHEISQEEIDAAIIQCLRIFAARGRQLRLQRERDRLAHAPAEKGNADAKQIHAEPENKLVISGDLEIEDKSAMTGEDNTCAGDAASDEPVCPS